MTETVRRQTARSASPRHMRKLRFGRDVPPTLLGTNVPLPQQAAIEEPRAPRSADLPPASSRNSLPKPWKRKATLGQKRLVALAIVILVSLAIPLLVLTLIFAG